MRIYCLKNEFISDAAEYTISYLLNRNGYFFDWISKPREMSENSLLLVYKPEKVQIGISEPVLLLSKHFELEQLHKSNFVWKEVTIETDNIPILASLDNQKLSKSDTPFSSFDLVANIYYHLARLEEINFQHPEDVDQNIQNSILFKHGNFTCPVVDILGNLLGREIETKFQESNIFFVKKAFYPEAQSFAIALTHDVDFIRAFHPLKKKILKLLIQLGLRKNITIENIEKQDNDTWGFDRLLPFYKDNNYKATFFFMAKYLENLHFRYRISSKKIRQLFNQLKDGKHEIAFHSSRYAFENPKRYLKEKRKLEKISGTQISGLRHHYLRCLYPQIWRTAAELDLKYETGMIHRRHSGFRAGTCFPFPAFDHSINEKINIIEFPTTFFENTLPDTGYNFEASKEIIQQFLSIVKKHGGLYNILWHSNNICQLEKYRKLWEFITKLINEENAFIQPLIEQYNWYKQREQIKIESVRKSETGYVFQFDTPAEVQFFCLLVPADYEFKSDNRLQHDPIKNTLIIENDRARTKIIIEAQTI